LIGVLIYKLVAVKYINYVCILTKTAIYKEH